MADFVCGQPWNQQYQFNTTTQSDITGWTSATGPPLTVASSSLVVTRNYVYLVDKLSTNVIYYAPITNGVVGSWSSGTQGRTGYGSGTSILTKAKVVSIPGGSGLADFVFPVNSDGTLASGSASTAKDTVITSCQAFVGKNNIFLHGFVGTTCRAYYGDIDTNGDITWGTIDSGWTTTITQLDFSLAIIGDPGTTQKVYFMGGMNASYVPINSVMVATMTNGSMNSFNSDTNLYGAKDRAGVIVTRNRVFLLGGDSTSTVYTAPISNNTIGTWALASALPISTSRHKVFLTSTRVYFIDGVNMYWANFEGGKDDYTDYVYPPSPPTSIPWIGVI